MTRGTACGLAALVAISCLAAAGTVWAGPAPRYVVDPWEVSAVLAAPPSGPTFADQAITITRGRASRQEMVRYSVAGHLVSEEGRTLPAQWVRIQNEYGDPPASTDVVVLAGGDSSAAFQVLVMPQAWTDDANTALWRYAGNYTGQLVSPVFGAPPVDVTVTIQPYAVVSVMPDTFTVVAQPEDLSQVGPWGPGSYLSQETVTVTVRANFRAWELWRELLAPAMEANPARVIPVNRWAISEGGGSFVPVAQGSHLWLSGNSLGEPRLHARTLRLQVTLTWDDWKGSYQGQLRLALAPG